MEDKEFSSMNVIPLVDIMLVLLTIVLITATFMVQGELPVSLPQAKSSEQREAKSFQVVVDKEGSISFEGRRVSLKELEEILTGISRESVISIYADRDARVQALVDVLDLLKRLGFTKAHIKTELLR